MRTEAGRVWIQQSLLDGLVAEANRLYPDETGGVLLGYRANGGSDTVIAAVTGPGPRAMHARNSFIPDYDYQEARIAELYLASGRRYAYLGDWHTHPDSMTAKLSRKDRRTLAEIATYVDARNPHPVMGILAGTRGNWMATFWQGDLRVVANRFFGSRVKFLSALIT